MFYTFEQLKTLTPKPLIGKKAGSLLELLDMGAPVPDGACFSTDALALFLEDNDLLPLIQSFQKSELGLDELEGAFQAASIPQKLVKALKGFLKPHKEKRFAVRSSGVQEDMAGASFAGLYTTLLNVQGFEAILEALKTCWLSLFSERVMQYIQKQGLDPTSLQMGVIIQEMVPAEKSGVLFSVNPLKGLDKEMLIEAVWGLGEGLVSGHITPDQYAYNWFEEALTLETIQNKKQALRPIAEPPFIQMEELTDSHTLVSVLTLSEVQALVDWALKIQEACGYPVDIEWSVVDGQLYILQSRPITTFSYQAIAGEWTTADFKDGGVSSDVCTPLMWSLYDFIWEITMPSYLRKTHLLASSQESALWGDMFFGRPYWNVGAVKEGLKKLPGFVEREFDEDLGIEVSYEGKGYLTPTNVKTLGHGLRVLSALQKSFSQQLDYCEVFTLRQQQRLQHLAEMDESALSAKAFFDFYEQFILYDYFRSEASYFNLIFDNSNVTTLFKDSFSKYKGKVNYLALISGLENLSHLKQNYDLWDISRDVLADSDWLEFWKNAPIEDCLRLWREKSEAHGMPLVSAFIQKYFYHSTHELDITVPRFGEDPSFVFENLKQTLVLSEQQEPRQLNARQAKAYQAEREKLLALVPFYQRKKMAKLLERLRQFLWWREELRDLSTRYYYYVRKFTLHLAQLWFKEGRLKAPEDIFFLPYTQILLWGQDKLSTEAALKLIQKNRAYYQSFRNFKNPNEIGSRYTGQGAQEQSGNSLKGVACSAGCITGRARVIQNIYDAERLEPGDLLITEFTDPGWTPKFGLIAGVATETGGMLSHAAVISREYGIPAVLAIQGLTQKVKDGQKITIDGNQGYVILASDEDKK